MRKRITYCPGQMPGKQQDFMLYLMHCFYIIYLMNETYPVTGIMHLVVQKKIKEVKKNIKHDLCSPKKQIF